MMFCTPHCTSYAVKITDTKDSSEKMYDNMETGEDTEISVAPTML